MPADGSSLAIETRGLCKNYGPFRALHDVNLRVPHGSLFGFLGPNGAGKTTAIRILLGLLRASRGAACILDRDARAAGPRIRADVGYLPGDVRFYDGRTGAATLRFFAAARRRDCGDEIARLTRRFDLPLEKRVRSYSRGMKQKLGLIQALMHRPRILILDEPTTSLDPLVQQTLYEELRATAAEGRTVLFSSHTLSEVGELCDRIAIVRKGRLIEQESISVLRRRAARHLEITFRDHKAPADTQLPDGIRNAKWDGPRLSATWAADVDELLRWLHHQNVDDLSITPPSLEELFMTYYDGHDGDAPFARAGNQNEATA